MKSANKPKRDAPFELLKMTVDCVLFMRTRAPVDPLVLVREICSDAAVAKDVSLRRSRFINKLTPITLTGKANEKGLEDVASKVLPSHFQLAEGEGEETGDGEGNACSVSTYCYSPSRNSSNAKFNSTPYAQHSVRIQHSSERMSSSKSPK